MTIQSTFRWLSALPLSNWTSRFPAVLIATTLVAGSSALVAQDSDRAFVTGAGSSFAMPVVSSWAKSYRQWLSGTATGIGGSGLDEAPVGQVLDYEPAGSLAGIMRVSARAVDFGATDRPLTSTDLEKNELLQFPIVIGGIVAVVNIEGIAANQLKLTGSVLADIYLGKIKTWSDPAITALNPGLSLPDRAISVIHRADGSGTTYNLAEYLSKVSPLWKEKVGADLILKWPTGTGVKGNSGLAAAVAETKDSIGYVQYSYAKEKSLATVLLQNRSGRFPAPEITSFQKAAESVDWTKAKDFAVSMTDAPGENAYPLVATVYVLMHKKERTSATRWALSYFKWSLSHGSADATALGYVALPKSLVEQIETYWKAQL